VLKNIGSFYRTIKIANELSRLTKYYDRLFQVAPLEHDDQKMLEATEAPQKSILLSIESLPFLLNENERVALLFNGNFNHGIDIQNVFKEIMPKISAETKILALLYNPYLKFLYQFLKWCRLRKGKIPNTFLTEAELKNICTLSNFELVKLRPCLYFPFYIPFFSNFINSVFPLLPFFNRFSLVSLAIIRPLMKRKNLPSLSIVIPARNEEGNIEAAIERLPSFKGAAREIIFVEGHSTDNTWSEVLRVQKKYLNMIPIQAYQQKGKGKSDAVRLGFSHARHDLLFILDADLTVAPENLELFYDAYLDGHGEFINGTRLIYPMESKAMRPLNLLGNKFFAKILSYILDDYISDSLCGTKVVSKRDYERMINWRTDFGDFDPFGDFELLFPAAQMGIKIMNVPIHYKDRTYGSTQIHRIRHGLMLFKMTIVGLFKIKAGKFV